jgi:hypothetical protein
MRSITVNIMRHGRDRNKVYVTVNIDGAEYTVNGDSVYVNVDRSLPPVSEPGNVSLYQDGKRLVPIIEPEPDGADKDL